MAELRKYNTSTTILFPLIKAGAQDFATNSDYTPVSGDLQISKDEGAFVNTNTTTPTHEGGGIWSIPLTATETSASRIVLRLVDSATKAVEDQAILIETYGNASAQHAFDLDTATQNVNVSSMSAGTVTAAAIATDAVDADALSTDARNEIADAVWDEDIEAAHGTDATAGLLLRVLGAAISNRANNATLNALLGVADSAGVDLPEQVWSEAVRVLTANTNLNDPTADAVADAVWDELKAGHVGAGSFGEEVQAHALSTEITALNDIAVDDVWNKAMSELGSVPGVTASVLQGLEWLFLLARNKVTQSNTVQTLRNDADSGDIGTASVSEAAGVLTRGEYS